jgi:hypothetical protein
MEIASKDPPNPLPISGKKWSIAVRAAVLAEESGQGIPTH